MKKRLAFFTLLFYFAFSLLITASALVPKSSSFYVADYANVISNSTEQTIIAANAKLEKLTRGQIVVVTVQSLEGLKSSEYATKLMNDWGVGDAKLNNGMLLLLSPKDKKGWLIQGSGIANVLTSTKINDMLDKYFWPDVDKGRYDSAINSTFRQMISWYSSYYNVTIPISASSDSTISKPAEQNPNYGSSQAASGSAGSSYGSSGSNTYARSGSANGYSSSSSGSGAFGMLFVFFIIIIVAVAIGASGRRRNGYNTRSYYTRPRGRGPGFGGGFVGGYMVGRSMGNHRDDEDRVNGGFGNGFGGQSSGGGGGRDDDDSSTGFGSGFGGHSSDGGGGRDDDSSGFGGFSGGGGGGSIDGGSSFGGGSGFDGGGGFSGGGGGGRD